MGYVRRAEYAEEIYQSDFDINIGIIHDAYSICYQCQRSSEAAAGMMSFTSSFQFHLFVIP